MNRDCLTCKKNNEQWENSCGYLKPSKRRKTTIDFPALASASITINKCPVWFYNKYNYLYDWYNNIKASKKDITRLKMGERIVYREFTNYINLRQEYYTKLARSNNGN